MTKDNLKKMSDYVEEFFKKIVDEKGISVAVDFFLLSDSKQKSLIKIKKIPDPYVVGLNAHLLVTINEDFFDKFSQDPKEGINEILIEQEVDKIEINYETGAIKIGKSPLMTSRGIVEKYTYEKVTRAIELEKLYDKSKTDKEKENKI